MCFPPLPLESMYCMYYSAAVMCASLPPPTNGQILYFNDSTTPYDHGTVANYICNTGFGIAGGDVNRVCSDDDKNTIGEWTRTTPTCECKQNL